MRYHNFHNLILKSSPFSKINRSIEYHVNSQSSELLLDEFAKMAPFKQR